MYKRQPLLPYFREHNATLEELSAVELTLFYKYCKTRTYRGKPIKGNTIRQMCIRDRLLVECVAAVLFGILFALAFCFVFSRHYFTAAGRRTGKRLFRRKIPAFTTPMRQETYKLLVMQGTALSVSYTHL